MRQGRFAVAILLALAAAGCTLEPRLKTPGPAVAKTWPIPPTMPAGAQGTPASDIGWRDFFTDPSLQKLLALSLENNRDLRLAALDVERARAQYRIERSALAPSVDLSGSSTREKFPASSSFTGTPYTLSYYSVGLGISSFELDLFGRLRSAKHAALESFLALEETHRAVEISLLGEVARAYLTLAADQELERLARETLKSWEKEVRIRTQEHDLGAISGLELDQATSALESSRVDVERFAGNVAQDVNALTLLVGAPVDPGLLPSGFERGAISLAPLPAGLPAEVLLRRPDVLAAEHQLRSANADIGVARAQLFPSISLTGSAGYASGELSSLFDAASQTWTFIPKLTVSIFHGGRERAGVKVAKVNRDAAVAQYERAIQSSFREVADALALSASLARQTEAQKALVKAAGAAYRVARQRRDLGRDSYLTVLDSQRTYYAAEQGLISLRLARQANRVTLYQVLGGGWREKSAKP